MIGQERMEAIVINGLKDGKNAAQIARETGIPLPRVQAAMHRARGANPRQAARKTRSKRRQVRGY